MRREKYYTHWYESDDMNQPKAMQVKPLVSSAYDQDFKSDPIPLSQILGITFVSIFLVGFGAIIYILEDGELLPEYIIVGLAIVIFYLYAIIPHISMHRLRVRHSIDELVFDSILLGRRWRSKRKTLSDSLYLRYNTYVTTSRDEDGSSSTTRHHDYNVHGNSDGKGDWKLNISNMMRDHHHPNNKAKEIAKSIGIKFKSR